MADIWGRMGRTMEVSEDGRVLTKKAGGNYARHVAAQEVLSSGVHTWEVELTSGATSNNNRDVFIGVATPGCDVEKGDHHAKGKVEDAAMKGKHFLAGDRVGVRLDCNDGSLRFYKNGEPLGEQFPAGTIPTPVVRAVELKCPGQCVTLLPEVQLV
ncbi:Uncharacterized protein (Fragment) [Durusdinium trenchii]|uniref:B30.2/SPRY domain-containing protein n=1 Tax=Durusdinium trenchii TaxID=1381693 RepID=A0ABP0SNA3_9DINO